MLIIAVTVALARPFMDITRKHVTKPVVVERQLQLSRSETSTTSHYP